MGDMMFTKMKSVKFIILLVIVAIIVTGAVFIYRYRDYIFNKQTEFKISDNTAIGEPDDVTLTIYYVSPCILTRYPWGVDDLIQFAVAAGSNITIDGSELEEKDLELLNQIANEIFVPVKKQSSHTNARLYYVLESKKDGKLFDVTVSALCSRVYVNGVEVEQNDRLIEFVLPFLPEKISEKYRNCQVACYDYFM